MSCGPWAPGGLINSADGRLTEVEKVASELISFDLRGAVANLRWASVPAAFC
jgi:hypothetical protein